MRKSKNKALLVVALILVGGLMVTDHVFLNKRGIASFEGAVSSTAHTDNYDLSNYQGQELATAFKHSLMQGLQVHKEGGAVGISWSLFQVKNSSGAKVYACERFPYMEVVLKAEGVANSGQLPTMLLRGPCLASDDGLRILPWMIPVKGLFAKLRENPMLRIPLADSQESLLISAESVYEPVRHWNVTSVKIYNDQESLSIDGYEMISLLDQPLTLDFSEDQ